MNPGNNIKMQPGIKWIVMAALLLTLAAWIMQMYSLINWEGALELGLQNDSFNGDEPERTLARMEKGVALADMFWPLPITIIAIIGILRKKQWGIIAAYMDFAICVYFPLFFAFQRWESHRETAIMALLIFAIPSLTGILALSLTRKPFTQKI